MVCLWTATNAIITTPKDCSGLLICPEKQLIKTIDQRLIVVIHHNPQSWWRGMMENTSVSSHLLANCWLTAVSFYSYFFTYCLFELICNFHDAEGTALLGRLMRDDLTTSRGCCQNPWEMKENTSKSDEEMKQDVSVFVASRKLSDNYPRFLIASCHLPSALVSQSIMFNL